jgi:uncharacterized protein YaaQ
MIKEGDYIICIKNDFTNRDLSELIVGETYEITRVITTKEGNYYFFIRIKGRIVDKLFSMKSMDDVFITLAQWRDNQINSILDD